MAHAVTAAPASRGYLDVERSFSGRRWVERTADLGVAEALKRQHGLPEIAARLLAARGVGVEAAGRFLNPALRDWFPDPSTFTDMDTAATVIEDAINDGRRCAVFADYDVDGGTSAAQLQRYFRARGRELRVYVPDRMAEGYGPSAEAFERLKAEGIELVITVDCGAAAHGPLEAAAAMGLPIVVFDHHLMSGPAPPALAVVNPNRPDCESGQGALTAAGVVLVALAAINREARRRASPGSNHLPDPMAMLDLAALGTVCDVAPLTGFNRAIVAQGLKILARGGNEGLKALAAKAGRPAGASVYDLGFVLGPRLNAGGRIGEAGLAARLLACDDPAEAAELAEKLDTLNAERRAIEAAILDAATQQADAEAHDRQTVIVGDRAWHPGVIGIVAGRLKERVLKPVIVLGGEGAFAKGSGRSITGVNLGAAVAAAAREGVLVAGGGHAMAAGLTMAWERLSDFREDLEARLCEEVAAAEGQARTLFIDAVAAPRGLNLELLAAVDRIGPYGQGHPEPVFALAEVTASYAAEVKGGHLRCVLEDQTGGKIRAIGFRLADTDAAKALKTKGALVHAAVRLKRNSYGGGDRAEAEIVDLAPG